MTVILPLLVNFDHNNQIGVVALEDGTLKVKLKESIDLATLTGMAGSFATIIKFDETGKVTDTQITCFSFVPGYAHNEYVPKEKEYE